MPGTLARAFERLLAALRLRASPLPWPVLAHLPDQGANVAPARRLQRYLDPRARDYVDAVRTLRSAVVLAPPADGGGTLYVTGTHGRAAREVAFNLAVALAQLGRVLLVVRARHAQARAEIEALKTLARWVPLADVQDAWHWPAAMLDVLVPDGSPAGDDAIAQAKPGSGTAQAYEWQVILDADWRSLAGVAVETPIEREHAHAPGGAATHTLVAVDSSRWPGVRELSAMRDALAPLGPGVSGAVVVNAAG